MTTDQLRFPIGPWKPKKSYTEKEIERFITVLQKYPGKYKRLVKKLTEEDLNKTYRDGSWNIRQLVVHLSDMHILHYGRMKQALSMDNPDGYVAAMDGWNAVKEVDDAPLVDALALLDATHKRYVRLIQSLSADDLQRTYFHPQRQIKVSMAQAIHMTAWHTRHHYEHIRIALGEKTV